jgi:hypothetical protein
MPIPSRLAGMPELLASIMRGNRQDAGEQRAAERHAAWQQNLAAVKAQTAREAQMQRGAMQQLQGDIENQMRLLNSEVGDMIPYQVQNPDGTPQHQEMWDEGLNYGDTMMNRPQATIEQSRPMTGRDRYDAEQLYSRAHGTNMPSSTALARMLGDGPPEQFVEHQWNANSGDGGMPFGAKQRAGYSDTMQEYINSSMADAMAKGPAGMKGSFGDRTDPIDLARKTIMQDVWTVARQIASQSTLIDEGRAFQQILDAMAKGTIDPIQISQMVGKDAVEGDEGFGGYFTRNTRGLQAQPLSRDQLRQQYETEYGPIGQANALGLPPPN